MTYIKYAFWGIVGLCLVIMGLANRDVVTLRALPEVFANPLGISPDIQMPLFMAIFIGVGIGLLIGFLWEWLREGRMRAEGRAMTREVTALKRQVDTLKTEKHEGKDEIIALLDKTG